MPKTKCKQSVDKQIAIAAAYALRGVITRGTASGDQTPDGIYEFGKTGTTDNAESTWFVGTTSKVATGVWIGNAVGHVSTRKVYSTPYCPVKASTQLALERHCLWRGVQTAVNAVYGGDTSWPAPESQYLSGGTSTASDDSNTTVPNVVGQSEQSAISQITGQGMSYVIGAPVSSDQPAGIVAQQSPAAGSQAQGHVTVTINESSG